jgi:hypothetical protein
VGEREGEEEAVKVGRPLGIARAFRGRSCACDLAARSPYGYPPHGWRRGGKSPEKLPI